MGQSRTVVLKQSRTRAKRAVLAVGYCRRSTERQEQSIPNQQRAIEKSANEHGLNLLRFYIDDARSGTTTIGRHAFGQMIADAQRPKCDFAWIIVYDVKRFGRGDNDEAGYYRHILKQHGVCVVYCSENFTGDRTDDLLRSVKQWQAREESRDLAKVCIRGLVSRATEPVPGGSDGETAGWWLGGAPPFGYDLRYASRSGEFLFHLRYQPDGAKHMLDATWNLIRTIPKGESVATTTRSDRARLVPSEPSRVRIVRRIFRMYVDERRGLQSIANVLNAECTPAIRSPQWCSWYCGRWNATGIRGILRNPAYVGDAVWNRHSDGRFFRIAKGVAVDRNEPKPRRLVLNDESDWFVTRNAHEPLIGRHLFEAAKQHFRRYKRA